MWKQTLTGKPGVTAEIEPDPTNNPLDRLRVSVNAQESHITAWDLADALARGAHPVIVRDHEAEHGYFYMDPCNLHPGEAEIVAGRLSGTLRSSNAARFTEAARGHGLKALLTWPD